MSKEYLMHYGVPGMKWGHRKNYYGQSGDTFRASNGIVVRRPKNATVAAFRKFQGTKIGGNVLNKISRTDSAYRGRRYGNTKMWGQINKRVQRENQAVREANQAHKAAQKERKNKIKSQTKTLNKQASFKEKLLYNNATRKKAAKYIVDNNMSVAEATKKAKSDARRNSVALVAAYSAVAIGTMAYEMRR